MIHSIVFPKLTRRTRECATAICSFPPLDTNGINNIVAAFRGMQVSKHSYAWLPRKCDYRTDRQTTHTQTDRRWTKWSLFAASQATHKQNILRLKESWTSCIFTVMSTPSWALFISRKPLFNMVHMSSMGTPLAPQEQAFRWLVATIQSL